MFFLQQFCHLCNRITNWMLSGPAKDPNYDLYVCQGCGKMTSAQPKY